MKFQEISEQEYGVFWQTHPLKSFLSSPKFATLRKAGGQNVYFVGVKNNDTLIAATMLYARKTKLNAYNFEAVRGFLLDYENNEVLEYFVKEVKQFVRKKSGCSLKIDPYMIYKQRDIDGNVVVGGIDHSHICEKLESLKFKKLKHNDNAQASWMFSLDVKGKTQDIVFKEMKQNTRNLISQAKKWGIYIRELGFDELNVFYDVLISTGERRSFTSRPLSYYESVYETFHKDKEVCFMVSELNLVDYKRKIHSEIQMIEEKINQLKDTKGREKRERVLKEDIQNLQKRMKEAQQIHDEAGKDIIVMSASMFMKTSPEIVYLSSGNYQKYMKFKSQYLLQWEMIVQAIEEGYDKYNFYGIPANIAQKPEGYGIYEFKRGFNGYVEQLIGEYEVGISYKYHLIQIIKKIMRKR